VPSLVARLTLALQHGGPNACRFVFGFAKTAGPSPLVEPLYQFATGRRGSVKLRNDILAWLVSEKLTSQPTHRFWDGGQWCDVTVHRQEIYDQPDTSHPPQVREKAEEAFYLIREDPPRAERLFREALELEPDAPDLWNNLAMALRMQGRHDESLQILHDLQARFPDYFFGQIALAQEQIEDGRYDDAVQVVGRLLERPRLHISEYAALGTSYVKLYLKEGKIREAQAWLKRIEEVCPDYSELGELRRGIQFAKMGPRLRRAAQLFE
jgi:lipopolysaccharide biosynthesis regulator YciM